MSEPLLHWAAFKLLGRNVVQTMRSVLTWQHGNSTLYVDSNDDVYLCQVLNAELGRLTWKKLDKLCGKSIVSFETGRPCVALSQHGRLYSCELDYDSFHNAELRPTKTSLPNMAMIDRLKIIQVVCGENHTVALTNEGQVYTWGKNDHGQCGVEASNQVEPNHITNLQNIRIVRASGNRSACISKSGVIYLWGEWSTHQPTPAFVTRGARFTELHLGKMFGVALTESGIVVAWSQEELRTGQPSIMSLGAFKFMKIAAYKQSQFTAAMSCDGKVYVIDCKPIDSSYLITPGSEYVAAVYTKQMKCSSPEVTHHTCLRNALAIETRSYRCSSANEPRILSTIASAFDDPANSDCKFIVQGEIIYVHKTILKLRSEYFRKMFNGSWKETSNIVEIKSRSYEAYFTMLKFLYTDVLDTGIDIDCLVEVLQLAHETLSMNLLLNCVTQIIKSLTIENVCMIYEIARDLEIKELLHYCRRFTIVNLTEILRSQSSAALPSELLKEFILFAVGNRNRVGNDENDQMTPVSVKRKIEIDDNDEVQKNSTKRPLVN